MAAHELVRERGYYKFLVDHQHTGQQQREKHYRENYTLQADARSHHSHQLIMTDHFAERKGRRYYGYHSGKIPKVKGVVKKVKCKYVFDNNRGAKVGMLCELV